MRPVELKTLDQLCKHLGTSIDELAGFTAEQDFLKLVLECRLPWVKDVANVLEAVSRNARDATRKDQDWWVIAHLTISGHPMAVALERLLPRE